MMSTFATGLGCVTRINLDHDYPFLLRFVGEKGVKLGEAPRMEATLGFGFSLHRCTRTNMGEVLNHNRRTSRGVLNNPLTEHVVVIFALPKQFPTQLFEMSLCR